MLILRDLMTGTKRFGELKKCVGNVSQKVLTVQLRAMEANGLVHREVYAEVPPRVEYSLTEKGLSSIPLLHSICHWATTYHPEFTFLQCQECPYQPVAGAEPPKEQ